MLPRTQRQKEVLDYITRFLAKHGHEPSYAQIARNVRAGLRPGSIAAPVSPWDSIDLSGTLAEASRRTLLEVERRTMQGR